MTLVTDDVAVIDAPPADAPPAGAPDAVAHQSAPPAPPPGPGDSEREEEAARVQPTFVVGAAAFTASGAAWMVGGLFRPALLARGVSLLGVLVAAGIVLASYRTRRPSTVQYAVLPAAAVLGAIVVAPDATGGTANLPSLVVEALTSGGLQHAPAPFDPGWRFLAIVVMAVLTAGAAINAVRLNRAKLAVAVPAVVMLGASTLQPADSELVAGAVGVLFVVAGLALAYGAELSQEQAVGARFEVRRLARSALMGVVLVVVMGIVSQLGFLFPGADEDNIVPPQRPPTPRAEKDRVLWEAKTDKPGPWRVGVLDGYDGEAWLLPPQDPKRVVELEDGRIPHPGADAATSSGKTYSVNFRLVDVRGHSLPMPGGAVRFEGPGGPEYDPRTGSLRLPERIRSGYSYVVEAVEVPSGRQLNEAAAPSEAMSEFLTVPPPPNEVLALLEQAPAAPFDRLQFVRDALYSGVVAAGAGNPVDVPPARVVELLRPGAEATPYEITAAEALLARWAGVPSRIGFGYHRGDQTEEGTQSFRPRHGAAWLEVWFEGHGWVPLVGVPPRAKPTTSNDDTNSQPGIQASKDLAVEIYVPARRQTLHQLYQVVRYWVFLVVPILLAIALLAALFPVAMKQVRARRRRHWAEERGPLGQILVSYAALRDYCHDLNLGDARLTPVEFADQFTEDAEHDELAYLVTRSVWGDLRRDLRGEDAELCEEAARSVQRRIGYEQPFTNRALAAISTASLRDPWSDQLPNAWPRLLSLAGARSAFTGSPGAMWRRLRRRAPVAGAAASIVLTLLLAATALTMGLGAQPASGSADSADAVDPSASFPDRLVPDAVLGRTVQREPVAEKAYEGKGGDLLVDDGRVYTFRSGERVEAVLQVARFKRDVDGDDRDLQVDIERSIGGAFRTYWFGSARLRVSENVDRRTYLWFPPHHNVVEILVTEAKMAESLQLMRMLVGYQLGFDPEAVRGGILLDAVVVEGSEAGDGGEPARGSGEEGGAVGGNSGDGGMAEDGAGSAEDGGTAEDGGPAEDGGMAEDGGASDTGGIVVVGE